MSFTGYWTFFCNPKYWDIGGFLTSDEMRTTYRVLKGRHQQEIRQNQFGIIRVGHDQRSKKELNGVPPILPGIYAIVKIVSGFAENGKNLPDAWTRSAYLNYSNEEIEKPTVEVEFIRKLPIPLLEIDYKQHEDFLDIFNLQRNVTKYLSEKSFNKIVSLTDSYEYIQHENDYIEAEEFPEGKVIERIHKLRERSPEVIRIAKENFKAKNGGRLFCEACDIDFENKYGDIGKGFIEGHHILPISEMEETHMTKPEDIVMLCPNCHRMVHKKRPWLQKHELRSLLKEEF